MTYYNTTHLSGQELLKEIRNAKTQKDKIELFFKSNPGKDFTPFDLVYIGVFESDVPITSIRRAMTDLTSGGILEKTGNRREGGFGKDNYTWILAPPKKEVQGELNF